MFCTGVVVDGALISIRPADVNDNTELVTLEKMCPQGTSLVLQFDRSPDFFARSHVYDSYRVYVAEAEGNIAGTVASTLKEFNVNRKPAKAVYIYDLRVYPDFRGKGIGSKLVQHVIAEESRADLAYGIITEDNNPSIALFSKLGFQKTHDFILFNIPLYKRKERVGGKVRQMTHADAAQATDLINNYYHNRDLFAPFSADDLLKKTSKLPDYGLQNIQVVEAKNEIVACAGLWDYSRIFRISILRVTTRLKMLRLALKFANIFMNAPNLPAVGEPFKIMYLRDFAYTDPDRFTELIEHCLNLSHSSGCNFLSLPLDPSDPATPLITKYKPITMTYHIYSRSLKGKTIDTGKTVHVDATDL